MCRPSRLLTEPLVYAVVPTEPGGRDPRPRRSVSPAERRVLHILGEQVAAP